MTKFILNRTGGPWTYQTLGFTATAGAILNGALSSPAITTPPDAFWAVYDGGSAETGITRFGYPYSPSVPVPETPEGYVLAYSDDANAYVATNPAEFFEIAAVANALEAVTSAGLAVETNARTAADTGLQTQITSLGTTGLAVAGAWTNSLGYAARTLVTYSGVAYVSNATTLTSEVPGASSKWIALPTGNDPTAVHLASPTQLVDLPAESGWRVAFVDASANILLGITLAGEVKIPYLDTDIRALLPTLVSTAPESGWRYFLPDESGNILFGVRSDGMVIAPSMALPAGVVTRDALATEVINGFMATGARQDIPEITGTTPNRKLWVNTRELARVSITTTGDPATAYVAPADRTVHWTAGGVAMWSGITTTPRPLRELTRRRLVGPGDSLTADGTYLARCATNLGGLTTVNLGMSGWASADIATRFGALSPALTITGNSVPASGAVAVTAREPGTGWRTGHTGSVYSWHGYLNTPSGQIAGTLTHTHDTDAWAFTRDASGSVTACPAGTPFVCTDADGSRDSVTLILAGRNNPSAVEVRRDVRSMVNALEPYCPQYVVLSVLNTQTETQGTSAYNTLIAVNNALAAEFGDHYFDWRTPFIHGGMARMGLTPTAGDNTAIALDAPPASLMQDATHPNVTYGYPLMGDLVSEFITAKGWITT